MMNDEIRDEAFEDDIPPEEMALLQLIYDVKERLDQRSCILNPAAAQQMMDCCDRMREAVPGPEARVTLKLHTPYKDQGVVHAAGRRVTVENPAAFVQALDRSCYLEVYAKTNGTVEMDLGYDRLVFWLE